MVFFLINDCFQAHIVITPCTQESLELTNKQTKPVAATCLSFPSNDVNKFIVGSEECNVYQGQRHGSKPGISLQFDGHWGPITSISSHRASGQVRVHVGLQYMLWWWIESF